LLQLTSVTASTSELFVFRLPRRPQPLSLELRTKAISRYAKSSNVVPFGSMPGVLHSFYFAGDYGRDTIGVRIEEGMNGKKLSFDCPTPLVSNLLWFFRMKELREAAALKRVAG
jgi:hypothetical protein